MLCRVVFPLLFLFTQGCWAESFLDGPTGRIHYQLSESGSGTPVVLVHGFSTPMWVWEPVYRALVEDGRKVLRFDLHGRGQSARAGRDSLELFHAQLDALRQGLNLQAPFDIVGLSMGGAITSSYTVSQPLHVRRVVLVAPFNTGRKIPLLGGSPIGEWLAEFVLVPISLRWGYRNNFSDADAVLDANPELAARFRSSKPSHDYAMALLSSLRNIISQDQLQWYEKLGQLQKPVLLVWGEDDGIVPFDQSPQLRAALGEARFLAVPDAGHLPHLERPEAVVPVIVDFLR